MSLKFGGITAGQRDMLARKGIDLSMLGRVTNDSNTDVDITIPDTPAQLEELMADNKRMRLVFAQNKMPELIRAYARNVMQKDQEIAVQVREQVQNELATFLKSNEAQDIIRPDLTPRTAPSIGQQRNSLYNPRAMGAQIDREFKDSADFFKAIWHHTDRDASLQQKLARVRNTFSSSVPSEGGFLIPETLRAELLRVSLETAIIRPRARVIPMETLRVPFPCIDSTSNASSVYGGITCYWTEEGGTLSDKTPQFGRVVLEAKKLTAYTEAPNEMIADSISSFQTFIDQMYPEAMGFYEDDAYINGTGVGEPLGILNTANRGLLSVTKETGQLADTIVWENIIKMFSRMLPSSLNRAVWLASIDTLPQLATMAVNVGVGGSAIWLNNGVSGPPASILGRPVIFTEKCPVVGDAGDIAFIDPAFYLIGDRQAMSATSSPHFKFSTDVTAFKIIQRVDGQPWLRGAITPKNGGNSLSPYVQIEARA
jgi:HK97 family phage major capsid protein